MRRLLNERRAEVFVSGAPAALLSREIASSLRGRAWPVLIHPFSFEEACRHQGVPIPEHRDILSRHERLGLEPTFVDWLRTGGFPEAQGLDAPSARRHEWILAKKRNNISMCHFQKISQDIEQWTNRTICISGQ